MADTEGFPGPDTEFDEIVHGINADGGLPPHRQIVEGAATDIIAAVPDVDQALAESRTASVNPTNKDLGHVATSEDKARDATEDEN